MKETQTRTKNKGDLIEEKVDNETTPEFGGPIGVTFMMVFFPMLMVYFWICLDTFDGKLFLPSSLHLADMQSWATQFADLAWKSAAPTKNTFIVYWVFLAFEALLAVIMPGPIVKGLPIPSENYKQLEYICNGVWSLYFTIVVSLLLHFSKIFPLTTIVDNFGPFMTAAIISGNIVPWVTYFWTIWFGKPHRMSGNVMYDMFMGAPLNPRIGKLDLKMWAEIRVPWVILFFISLSAAIKQVLLLFAFPNLQYEMYGTVTYPMLFMVLAHWLYVNACQKGEECIPTTWDIFYEKWGYMLIFWNLAGVPFTYCYSSIYLLKLKPFEHSTWYTVLCFSLLLVSYYIWDTANSQKNRFRMMMKGTYISRKTFPQLPWGTLTNPKYLKTEQGSLLLTDGWWGIARKVHYTADLMISLSWGLITGIGSFLPYFYFCFFVVVLYHRTTRDFERCAKKYGKDWDKYCQTVPYIFVPYVF